MADYRWVSTEIDEDAHRALVLLATERGVHPSTLVKDYVTRGLIEDAEAEFAPGQNVDLQVFAAVQKVKHRARIRAQLTQIAFEHTEHPSEETADLLKTMCELAGIAIEDLLNDVKDAREVPLIQDDGTGVVSAMNFLQSLIERGQEYSVAYVYTNGEKHGLSEYVLKAAKHRLGIVSKRRPQNWVWTWPDEDDLMEVPQSD